MTSAILARPTTTHGLDRRVMNLSVKVWFALAAIGHWLFLAYILAVFYPPVAQRGLKALEGMHLPSGFVEGDTLGNIAAVAHVLMAAVIIGGGPLQLIPAVRSRFPVFHRWLGRSYVAAAVLSAVGGLYMTWTRSNIGDTISHLGISGDGLLILLCAFMAARHAMARRMETHRRWAMRLFLVASAVWFFRVGLMAWTMLTGGIGIEWESFTGPFLYVLGFAQYTLPLAMLQWYFVCQRRATPGLRYGFAGTLFALTVFMGIGIFAATMGMWLPRM